SSTTTTSSSTAPSSSSTSTSLSTSTSSSSTTTTSSSTSISSTTTSLPPCDDGNLCTTDIQSPPPVGCEHPFNAAPCSDGNAATAGDLCSGGVCMGAIRQATLAFDQGENASVSAAFPAAGDARTDGSRVRVSLINMDPARYPAGCTGGQISVGGISGTAAVANAVAQGSNPLVRTTSVDFIAAGTAAAGSAVNLQGTCTVGGVQHQTRWQGAMANPPVRTPKTCAAQGK